MGLRLASYPSEATLVAELEAIHFILYYILHSYPHLTRTTTRTSPISSTMASKDSSGKKDLEVATVKDNFIPIFDGTPGAYREWRKRIQIYSRKMQLQKRESEAVLNLLGSLQGSAWRILEDYDLSKAEEAGAMDEILATLDKSFKYDSKVELPADFAAYFEHLSRRGGQTLLQFITEHDECLRRIQK